jgi:hypothetical protein
LTKKQYPYVQSFADKDGRVHNYFRRKGYPRVALPYEIGSPEFDKAYKAALKIPKSAAQSSLRGGVERRGAHPLIGVYLLVLKGKMTYIGSSLNMPRRVAEHRTNGRPLRRLSISAQQPMSERR